MAGLELGLKTAQLSLDPLQRDRDLKIVKLMVLDEWAKLEMVSPDGR